MGRYIVALQVGHNASACIGDSSGLLYAVQEERLNGEKNYWGMPARAFRACVEYVRAKGEDLLTVVHGGKQVFARYHSRDDILESYRRQETFAGKLRQRLAVPILMALQKNYGQDKLRAFLLEEGLGDTPIAYFDHHLAHAATAYYGLRENPGERYLVMTCDGAGDGLCASVRVMGRGETQEIASTGWEHSLGALYSWVTFG